MTCDRPLEIYFELQARHTQRMVLGIYTQPRSRRAMCSTNLYAKRSHISRRLGLLMDLTTTDATSSCVHD